MARAVCELPQTEERVESSLHSLEGHTLLLYSADERTASQRKRERTRRRQRARFGFQSRLTRREEGRVSRAYESVEESAPIVVLLCCRSSRVETAAKWLVAERDESASQARPSPHSKSAFIHC